MQARGAPYSGAHRVGTRTRHRQTSTPTELDMTASNLYLGSLHLPTLRCKTASGLDADLRIKMKLRGRNEVDTYPSSSSTSRSSLDAATSDSA